MTAKTLLRIRGALLLLEKVLGVDYIFAWYPEARPGQLRQVAWQTSQAGAIVIESEFTGFLATCQPQMELAIEQLRRQQSGATTRTFQELPQAQQISLLTVRAFPILLSLLAYH